MHIISVLFLEVYKIVVESEVNFSHWFGNALPNGIWVLCKKYVFEYERKKKISWRCFYLVRVTPTVTKTDILRGPKGKSPSLQLWFYVVIIMISCQEIVKLKTLNCRDLNTLSLKPEQRFSAPQKATRRLYSYSLVHNVFV